MLKAASVVVQSSEPTTRVCRTPKRPMAYLVSGAAKTMPRA